MRTPISIGIVLDLGVRSAVDRPRLVAAVAALIAESPSPAERAALKEQS
ncbi:MAG: hypothetical protein ACOH17_05645 [Cellulomonas sp.]